MTYPVYAQKARLPQWRPRFLFHRPRTVHYTRCLYPSPPRCSWAGHSRDAKASRDTKEIPRLRDTETPRHETSKLQDIEATRRHAVPLSSLNRPTPPTTTDRQLPLRLQPAGSFHPSLNRQSTERKRPASLPRAGTPPPCPATKKREAARVGAASRSFSCRRAPTSAPYPTLRRDGCCDVCGKP